MSNPRIQRARNFMDYDRVKGLVLVIMIMAPLAFAALAREPAGAPDTVEALRKRILELIDHPRYAAALWGIKIVSLSSRKTLFELNAEKLFSPASNSKLYTMAFALDRLGPDYRVRTSLYARTRPDARGTLPGDLIIYGRGDPNINARFHGGDIFKALEPLVASLTNAGVKRISGDLVGDDSYFCGPPFGPGWGWEDLQYYYGAEISALTINDNVLKLAVNPGEHLDAPGRLSLSPPNNYLAVSNRTRTVAKAGERRLELYRPLGENVLYASGEIPLDDPGGEEEVTVHNPAGLFVALFNEALTRHGIAVSGRLRAINWKDREVMPLDRKQWLELGSLESPPLRELVREVLKPSQNLYTDLILAHLAATLAVNRPPGEGTTARESGMRELNTFLSEAGIKSGETVFEEGSGLSRDNLTTPDATVTLLAFMSRHKYANIYLDALPIAGGDGTLKGRMKGTAAAGRVRAKTGSLRWANSLSGYVTTAAGEPLAFSLMLNRFQSTEAARPKTADLDAIAVLLAGFTGLAGKTGE